jgi:predicted RNA-binding Zn-ribbon protein involved in translation (DUF1610 family)
MLINCPSCGKALKVPDNAVGLTVACPDCTARFQVPDTPTAAADAPENAPAEPPEAVSSVPEEAPGSEQRRPCPMCGEMIVASAVKCRFCGEIFDETLRRAEKKKERGPETDRNLTGGDIVLAILPFLTNIACILGIVWMIQGRPKGAKMFGLALVAQIVMGVLYAAFLAGK